jgi:hypothetical protein
MATDRNLLVRKGHKTAQRASGLKCCNSGTRGYYYGDKSFTQLYGRVLDDVVSVAESRRPFYTTNCRRRSLVHVMQPCETNPVDAPEMIGRQLLEPAARKLASTKINRPFHPFIVHLSTSKIDLATDLAAHLSSFDGALYLGSPRGPRAASSSPKSRVSHCGLKLP